MMLYPADLIQQLQWVELRRDLLKASFHLRGNRVGAQEPPARCLRGMVALDDARARADLLLELERWLEEVHKQTGGTVQPRECFHRAGPFESVIADEAADDRRVLLLDPGLVILVVRPRSRELDSLRQAILQEGIVEELSAVVYIDAGESERQTTTQAIDCFDNEATLANQQRQTLRLTTRDIGQRQRVDETAGCQIPAVGDQVHLHEAWNRIVLIRECSDRHTLAKYRRHPPNTAPPAKSPDLSQQPVDRRGTHRHQLRSDLGVETQMAVALERRQENRKQGSESLAAHPVRCLPQHDQCLAGRFVVYAGTATPSLIVVRTYRSVEDANRRLAVIPADRSELLQNASLRFARCGSVSIADGLNQLLSRGPREHS